MKKFLATVLLFLINVCYSQSEKPFFQATKQHPYHISVGAVLFNDSGKIACHHFKEILGQKNIYILMRESMENDETILATLKRGLHEEFGATATPIAYLGALSGFLSDKNLPFEKTTLYIACKVNEWDITKRDQNDEEASSIIEWLSATALIEIMQSQGRRFHRVDADESEMIKRALPFIEANSHNEITTL